MSKKEPVSRRRVLIAVAAVPVFVCLVVGGLCKVKEAGWERDLAATLEELEADGLGLGHEELYPPAGPVDAADHLERPLAAMEALGPQERSLLGAPALLANTLADPSLGNLRDLLWNEPEIDPARLPDIVARVRALTARLEPLDRDVDRALEAERCVFETDWDLGTEAVERQLVPLRDLVCAYAARAIGRLHGGDSARAWADALRVLRLAGRDPCRSLDARLSQLVCGRIAVETVECMLDRGPPPGPPLRDALIEAFRAQQTLAPFTRALRGDTDQTLTSYSADLIETLDRNGMKIGWAARIPFWAQLRWSEERSRYAGAMAEGIRASALPFDEAAVAFDQLDTPLGGMAGVLRAPLAGVFAKEVALRKARQAVVAELRRGK